MENEAFNPGLVEEQTILADAYVTMLKAGYSPDVKIPFIVWLLENPKSPLKLRGAVSLFHHDLIHFILGRGLTLRDEAFCIGYTMASNKRLSNFEIKLFKLMSRRLYPKKFRFSEDDLVFFDHAVKLARANNTATELDSMDAMKYLNKPLKDVRAELGIDQERLLDYYAEIKI